MSISFKTTKSEAAAISHIVDRAEKILKREVPNAAADFDRMSARMDITAAHANGSPLDLTRLCDADDFNLLHDFLGIQRHLDRSTGRLSGHFVPRFAA